MDINLNHYLSIYPQFRISGLDKWRITHAMLHICMDSCCGLDKIVCGKSFLGKPIYAYVWGKGDKTILIWSQMHGDEPTATKSIVDLTTYLIDSKLDLTTKNKWNNELRIVFIPMLNPDGAELWERNNGQNIDINRDARRFTSPEAQILREAYETYKPQWAFNLHDQSSYYAAGDSSTPATITLLAPPINAKNDLSENLINAQRMVAQFYRTLQPILPNSIGRWHDDYEPRAFGEWMQANGVSTVLIESGACVGDPDRQIARKLNFALLLYAFEAIANDCTALFDPSDYNQIPYNQPDKIFDWIIHDTAIEVDGRLFITDRGSRNGEITVGDLSDFGSLLL